MYIRVYSDLWWLKWGWEVYKNWKRKFRMVGHIEWNHESTICLFYSKY